MKKNEVKEWSKKTLEEKVEANAIDANWRANSNERIMKSLHEDVESLKDELELTKSQLSTMKDDVGYITKAFRHYKQQMSEVNKPLTGGVKYEI